MNECKFLKVGHLLLLTLNRRPNNGLVKVLHFAEVTIVEGAADSPARGPWRWGALGQATPPAKPPCAGTLDAVSRDPAMSMMLLSLDDGPVSSLSWCHEDDDSLLLSFV